MRLGITRGMVDEEIKTLVRSGKRRYTSRWLKAIMLTTGGVVVDDTGDQWVMTRRSLGGGVTEVTLVCASQIVDDAAALRALRVFVASGSGDGEDSSVLQRARRLADAIKGW